MVVTGTSVVWPLVDCRIIREQQLFSQVGLKLDSCQHINCESRLWRKCRYSLLEIKRNALTEIREPVESSATQLQPKAAAHLRPRTITVIAWILIAGGLVFLAMKPFTWQEFSLERNIWNCAVKFTAVVCGIGLLGMRRWAVVVYLGLFALSVVLIYAWPQSEAVTEQYSKLSTIALMFVVPAVFSAIILPHWDKMRW